MTYEDVKVNTVTDNWKSKTTKKRVGRGHASTHGKTAGKGHKGQGQRNTKMKIGFQGGQTPLQRRFPKMGSKKIRKLP